jgi:DNA-binding GntR family transcriptional regulator
MDWPARFGLSDDEPVHLFEGRNRMIPAPQVEDDGLAGEAYTSVRNRILRGELVMGQCLSRRKLAAELGMSFLPVSEALLRLEHEGLLESRPRAGTRVRIPTREDIEGHYVVREALEVKSAILFAERASRPECSELMKLAVRVDLLYQQVEVNRSTYLILHERLHRRIAECTGCQALTDAINHVCALASVWGCAVRSQELIPATHESLTKALAAGDATAAAEAMLRHLRSEMDASLNGLKLLFELQKQKPASYSRTFKARGQEGSGVR